MPKDEGVFDWKSFIIILFVMSNICAKTPMYYVLKFLLTTEVAHDNFG